MENDLAELPIDELIATLVGGDTHTGNRTHTGNDIITTDQLADFIGITANRVGVLAREGHIPRVGKGRFQQREAVRSYCEHLRKQASGRGASNPEYTEQKTRLAREQADKAEMQNAVARRELISAADVEREWSSILRDVRAAMLAVPSRLQQRLGHLTTHDIAMLDREIRDALAESADAD
jgi:phage terminase Nu1 subunit (DNA packaging protein)